VVLGPDKRKVTCGIYRTSGAFELRMSYTDNEILGTQLFSRTPDVIERLTDAAERWRVNLVAKRFRDTR